MILMIDSTHLRIDLPEKQNIRYQSVNLCVSLSMCVCMSISTLSIVRVCVRTSKLCGAGEIFFNSTAEFRIILKVIKVMFYPLTEYIQNPNDTHTDIRPTRSQTLLVLMAAGL